MEQPTRKRGRPRIVVTQEVIEARRVAKQQRNRQRSEGTVSSRQRSNIDQKKQAFASTNTMLDIGAQDQVCGYCMAAVWDAEFTGRHVGPGPKGYTICCGKGKVELPLLQPAPPELGELLAGTGRRESAFRNNCRMYNNIFAMCSFGGSVDETINNGSGPYVFRVNNHVFHNMGSLLPPDGHTPKYAQFYMYDGQEAIEHRLRFPRTPGSLDPEIVALLLRMLDRENVLVGIFKQLRDQYPPPEQIPVTLRLLERRTSDGRFVNLPGGNDYEFAGLAVDHDLSNRRDILVYYKQGGLERITELHPCFMSLQYPLLFPRGEDGYRLHIKHRGVSSSDQDNTNTVSMREFQAFRFQFRPSEGHTLLFGGRLFLQYVVDAWCCICVS